MMSKQLEEIFNECVERLQQGDSIENCLVSYPEVAAELEILLRTVHNVNWRASMVQPRPEFKAYARARFIGAQYAAARMREPRVRPTIFSLQRAWVPALAVVLLLVFSGVGTAAAASNAMPDEPLYSVKLATEQVRLTLAFSEEAKAELNVKLVETRTQEIATMATQGKPEQVAIATDRLAQHLEAAEQAIIEVEETKTKQAAPSPAALTVPPQQPGAVPAPEPSTAPAPAPEKSADTAAGQAAIQPGLSAEKLRESLAATISRNVTALENARDKSPEEAREALQKAIDMAKNRGLKLQQQSTEPGKEKPGQNSIKRQNAGNDNNGSSTVPINPAPIAPSNSKGTSNDAKGAMDVSKTTTKDK